MYFWNIKKLKAQIIERPLTEREALPYLIATTLMYLMILEVCIFALSPDYEGSEPTRYEFWDYLSVVFTFIVTILGTIWIFRKNRINTENFFLQRYTTLGWVVSIRMSIFFVLAILGLAITDEVFGWRLFNLLFESNKIILLINVVFYLFYYWYFGKQIADVAEKARY